MKKSFRHAAVKPQAVKRRVSARRRSLVKVLGLFLAATVLAAAGAAGYFGGAAGLPWINEKIEAAPVFRLKGVIVAGNRNLGEADLMEAAGLTFGESILLMDLGEIRTRILTHSLVRNAAVRRRLPSELIVEIEERTPAALLRGNPRYIVDTEGYVMAVAGTNERYPLPCLSGVDMKDGEVTPEGIAELKAGVEIYRVMGEEHFPPLDEVDCVDFSAAADAVIVSIRDSPPVHIGRSGIRDRLRRWKLVSDDMKSRWGEVEYIDLRADGMVVTKPLLREEEESGKGRVKG